MSTWGGAPSGPENRQEEIEEIEEIFRSMTKAPQCQQDHIEVGFVRCAGAPASAWSSLIELAMERGRQLGGDAIMVHAYGLARIDDGRGGYGKFIHATVLRYGATR